MSYPAATFTDFIVQKEGKKIQIRACLAYKGLDQVGNLIKEFTVIEEENAENKLYRLGYELPSGAKTSGFAFTTYQKAEALVSVIKSTYEAK